MSKLNRRHFLALGAGAAAAGAAALTRLPSLEAGDLPTTRGYGPLIKDPKGVLDLPKGFSYVAMSKTGEVMSDGLIVPGAHDGMAAFAGPKGSTLLVRNHEQDVRGTDPFGQGGAKLTPELKALLFDATGSRRCIGGTTTLRFDTKSGKLEAHWLSLSGTLRNCAGGPTPWGSWLTCEEAPVSKGGPIAEDHGWVFEVPATPAPKLHDAKPLLAMGRFNHEACTVDPKTGAVYQTEDRVDGLIYRFLPTKPGTLSAGGKLQALAIKGAKGIDTNNTDGHFKVGVEVEASWIDLEGVDAPKDDLRHRGQRAGAATFVRGEGMWWGEGAVFFCCTSGGEARRGQVWRYTPDPKAADQGRLALLIEPNAASVFDNVDNLCVAPWGDLYACEDGRGGNGLVGITPKGLAYRFAENRLNNGELAGACASPDGSTLFVNLQHPGVTLAIRGPWRS